jgi:hypothetical protein
MVDMNRSHGTRARRLRARFTLAHVEERADEHLRGRWQRRLDAGEEMWCWRCRLQGNATRIDPRRWHLSDSARSPECPDCHATDADGHDVIRSEPYGARNV